MTAHDHRTYVPGCVRCDIADLLAGRMIGAQMQRALSRDDALALADAVLPLVREREAAAWDECHERVCGIPARLCGIHGNPYRAYIDTHVIPPAETVEHDEGCCMNGVPATAGPHPDCPGVRALEARPTPPEGAKP